MGVRGSEGDRGVLSRQAGPCHRVDGLPGDRKSTRLNSSHLGISYAVFCLKKEQCFLVWQPPQTLYFEVVHPFYGVTEEIADLYIMFFFFWDCAPPNFSLFPVPDPSAI